MDGNPQSLFSSPRKRARTKAVLVFVLIVASIAILPVGISRAVGQAFAFGRIGNQTVKGHRVYLWTGTPPNGQVWTAAPVGKCTAIRLPVGKLGVAVVALYGTLLIILDGPSGAGKCW